MTNPAFSDLIQKLEAERNNLDYKTPNKKVEYVEVVIKEKVSRKEQETRDKLMFNAGRAAAGATDQVAVNAYAKLLKEISE